MTVADSKSPRRVFLVVIDALGVGALPDAHKYDDRPTDNTLGGIDREASQLNLPAMASLGVGNILPLSKIPAESNPKGSYGKMAEYSQGKDTTTGHWEMAGIYLETPFPTYPDGFPPDIMDAFVQQTGCGGYLGNIPASGTAIIEELGEQHLKTGFPIVYTSADSVFQIATHADKVPVDTLYRWCETARNILQGEHQVSRVIARPFHGKPGSFERLGAQRHDYAITPPEQSVLNRICQQQGLMVAIGKIKDIYCGHGVTHALHTQGNTHGLSVVGDLIANRIDLNPLDVSGKTLSNYRNADKQLLFVNLVDTDMKYGHRRDVEGYARALEEIDTALSDWLKQLGDNDLLLITGDHGCDPTAPGSDHTREYVPVLMYNKHLPGQDLGTRESFADMGQTVLHWLGFPGDNLPGVSMLSSQKEPALA